MGIHGYSGDSGAATSASLAYPTGVAVDAAGNIYIVDYLNRRIRKVNTSGIISTVAGNGAQRYSGDGNAATNTGLYPFGVAIDTVGNIYIADGGNIRILKVDTSGVIRTVAGNGIGGYSGDGGAATSASLNGSTGVAVDAAGNIYIADEGNELIRKVNTSGIINTVAGNNKAGYSGDGGAATSASLNNPEGIAVDAVGNIYIADQDNNRIRKVDTTVTLPVTLSYFTGIANNKTITTEWQTAAELNTSHFTIQRSTDGTYFTDIGKVNAVGSGANSYSFTDNNPVNGINYYRLQSVDKDGAVSFSKIVSVQLAVNSNQLRVYPNPSKDKVTINGNHIASVQVIDNIGRVVKTISLKDATNPSINVNSLPVGVYHLRVQTSDGVMSTVGFVKE